MSAHAEHRSPLEGLVAIVTGGSRGIGRAMCLGFARSGADVVVAARSTEAAPSRLPGTVESVALEIQALGARALAAACDVTDEASVAALVERATQSFRRVDILVNNAAYLFRAPVTETPLPRWDRVIEVNLRGPLLCTRAVLPLMMEQGSGRIVNISSGAAVMNLPEIVSYAASKAALEALTRGLAAEVSVAGVAVNALRIDRAVATEGAAFLNPDQDYSGWETPEAIAAAAVWLASQDLTFTGHVVESSKAGSHGG